jgi:hypothetical protein
MSNSDDSEKVANLDSLLEEMLTDARQITKDLTEGITNTKVAAILGFVISFIQLLILRDNLYRGPFYVLIWGLGFGTIFYHSIRLYRKYVNLQSRYSRFFEIHDTLESM